MRCLRGLALSLALVAAAVLAPVPAQAHHYVQADAVWQDKCQWTHTNNDDPIVFPGVPGASHRHDFFGNTSTDAFSTTESLSATGTTCRFGANAFKPEPNNHSAYWAPALLKNGVPIPMTGKLVDAYYFLGEHHPSVQPFPLGLRMIAGNANATSPQSTRIVRMKCVDNKGADGPVQSRIPDCRSGTLNTVVVHVDFPECWDGVNLDSPNHKNHMAYPSLTANPACPATHPVKVPKLGLTFRYVGFSGGPGTTFSSGGVYSAHADFWNTWEPARQQELVTTCLNAVRNCRYLNV